MSRIRVLQVVWRLARGGGKPVVVRGLLRNIDRRDFDVHVCTIRPLFEEDRVDELGDGITYHPLGLEGRTTTALRARAIAGITRVIQRVRPDVLHTHGGVGWYSVPGALLQPRAGRLLEVQDAPQSRRLTRGNYALERLMARRLRYRAVVHSRAVQDGLVEAWGVVSERITLFALGIDLERFVEPGHTRAQVRAELGVPLDAPLVTYVARLVPEKRPELFVEVAARVARERDDVVFALVGSGSRLEPSRELVRTLGLESRIRVPGFVEDLPSLYHASDLFLSTSAYEGFGLAIAEAMASGVPAVSTLVGGVADVVGDAGVLEPSDDPDVLAAHVLALLSDPQRRVELAQRARQRARDFLDVQNTTRAFEDTYRAAVRPNRSGAERARAGEQ